MRFEEISFVVRHVLLALSRLQKRLLLTSFDVIICFIATAFSLYLRLGGIVGFEHILIFPTAVSILLSQLCFNFFRFYEEIYRHFSWLSIASFAKLFGVYSLTFFLIFTGIGIEGIPRTIGIIQPLVLAILVIGSRLFAGKILTPTSDRDTRMPVLIYGAGKAGRLLAESVKAERGMRLVCFIDDDTTLLGRTLLGKPIKNIDCLDQLITENRVQLVFLAIPSLPNCRKAEILEKLSNFHTQVRLLPNTESILEMGVSLQKTVDPMVSDLLGREEGSFDTALIKQDLCDKRILITGAGGTIGGELVRQIATFSPRQLVLIESSEFALYELNNELDSLRANSPAQVISLLGSIQDSRFITGVFTRFSPQIVFHAAAFKHVNLVENNIVEAFKNNVLGTHNIAAAAVKFGAEKFILISSDKAVRPTNVMGATKRVAELVLHRFHIKCGGATKFAMVRFGNVLASSGSVVPRFVSQIQKGGPVTVTHPEVTRFFMTVTEAVYLVMYASVLVKGDDVFLLDMGPPVKIADLASKLIKLSGFQVKTEMVPEGDIEIVYTGLKPGEKLYEELLISGSVEHTEHAKINRCFDERWVGDIFDSDLHKLKDVDLGHERAILRFLDKHVEGFEAGKRSNRTSTAKTLHSNAELESEKEGLSQSDVFVVGDGSSMP